MKVMRPGEANKRGNVVTARIVPALLLGIIGYSSWVVTKHVCLDYLIHPPRASTSAAETSITDLPPVHHRQTEAAIVILVIFYLLLLITLTCFGRLLYTIVTHPGFVPRGPQWYIEKERKKQNRASAQHSTARHKEEAFEYGATTTEGYTPRLRRHGDNRHREYDAEKGVGGGGGGYRPEEFWHKDVFVCGWDGRPPFCSTCYNYKPDRAHHCRELGRCVLKMDHFCPWVGGIVSETSFKFFIQFTFWAALFCLDTLVVVAYYFAQRRRDENFINVHWILVLAFAALFFVFSAGMCGSSLQFAFVNSSTIENLTRRTKVWYLAVYIPERVLDRYYSSGRTDLRLISYPRPPSEQFQILQQHGAKVDVDDHSQQDVVPEVGGLPTSNNSDEGRQQSSDPHHASVENTAPSAVAATRHQYHARDRYSPSSPQSPTGNTSADPRGVKGRTFAILETKPGENPWDIGPFNNFREVMGYSWLDWFFPLHRSPLVDHGDLISMYKLGPLVEKMKREAGIDDDDDGEDNGRPHGQHDPTSGQAQVNTTNNKVEERGSGRKRQKRRHHRRRRRRRSETEPETSKIR
ncbi:Palmitoyltransferase pfa5 [Exophiala dermatitidis]